MSLTPLLSSTPTARLDWGLDPQAAIDLPNGGSRNGPTELEVGTGAVALEPKLRALGHDTIVIEPASGLHAIVATRAGWMALPTRDAKAPCAETDRP